MAIEIKAPSPGESITEVFLESWLVEDGSYVEKNQEIAVIESDKATLSVVAEEAGIITIKVGEGETIEVDTLLALIEPSEKTEKTGNKDNGPELKPEKTKEQADLKEEKESEGEKPEKKPVEKTSSVKEKLTSQPDEKLLRLTPLARKMAEANDLSDEEIVSFLKRQKMGKEDIGFIIENRHAGQVSFLASHEASRNIVNKKMSPLRKKLAERLVAAKNETAMLTTFNEVNMSPIFNIRKKYKDIFREKHGINLGFMSFFLRASAIALQHFPQVNSQIDGDEIVSFDYVDISIAVSTPKGLVVPVIRNAHLLDFAGLEKKVKELAEKGRENKLTLEEMEGGTFTISNGGVFGSMLSTPIINPPQSAILGMHNIVERPIVVEGKIEIHPVMYLALSYDHRIVDGRESVSCLVKIKEMLENPEKMLFNSKDPVEILLGI